MSSTINGMGLRMGLSLLALAAAACGAAPGEGTEACVMPPVDTESAAPEGPGAAPQGLWANGIWQNGRWQNGLWSNAVWSNGVWTNAAWSNGIWSNGIWSNGLWTNGFWSNGFARQGFQLQGLSAQGITLNGTTLGAVSTEGRVITGAEVVGAELELLNGVRLTIDSYETDDSELAWYTLTYEGQNVCGEGIKGTFVPGVWNPEGALVTGEGLAPEAAPFTFSCSTGVIAKCVTWGYEPWLDADATDLHQTCTRLARADYCGNGVPHTENGTLIDVFDVQGIQVPASKADEMAFEAAWGPDGAVCVNQTRYADRVVEQGGIEPSCWSELPRCTSLDEGAPLGATMANLSLQGERTFCEPPAEY